MVCLLTECYPLQTPNPLAFKANCSKFVNTRISNHVIPP
ncbi:hypothetical protein pHac1_5 (plasmid) [Helicobacter acinonychis str. Sheeba]|uniref:Uncharacterized protein n=1 Tax=Helicobacter acinonychis (strain Sheeba) TaxID=382638 RepID=Q17V40_HELAH|nr:hypothetical protein pHac1_5 [Helicobacter acinonychis str. Sheeba]